jgi:outer membrane protein assembly factor BamB
LAYGNGVLYGSNANGTYAIDPLTGSATLFSSFHGESFGSALAYGNGVLYGSNANGTYAIDPLTGSAALLSSFHGESYGSALAVNAVPIMPAIFLFSSGVFLLGCVAKNNKRNHVK